MVERSSLLIFCKNREKKKKEVGFTKSLIRVIFSKAWAIREKAQVCWQIGYRFSPVFQMFGISVFGQIYIGEIFGKWQLNPKCIISIIFLSEWLVVFFWGAQFKL